MVPWRSALNLKHRTPGPRCNVRCLDRCRAILLFSVAAIFLQTRALAHSGVRLYSAAVRYAVRGISNRRQESRRFFICHFRIVIMIAIRLIKVLHQPSAITDLGSAITSNRQHTSSHRLTANGQYNMLFARTEVRYLFTAATYAACY